MAKALAEAFLAARNEVFGIKQQVVGARNASLATAQNRSRFARLAAGLAGSKAFLATIEVVGGIQQYARDQLDDQTYDVGARFTDVQAAETALIAWILANYPASPSGHQLTSTFNPDGTSLEDVFTVAQLAGFVTEADAFILVADNFLT